MADHSQISLGDWLAVIGTAILSGISAAMGWFRSTSHRLLTRLEQVEATMQRHQTEIAVLHKSHEHQMERLHLLQEATRDMTAKLDELHDTLTQVLLALQERRSS